MRLLTPVLAVALAVLLACCGPDPVSPPRTPAPEPTEAPVFASEEEALAAAEEAYAAYLAISGEISDDGGSDPERVGPFVAESYFEQAVASFSVYSDNHLHTVGVTAADSFDLLYFDEYEVQVELCVDVSRSRVLNTSGVDVTPIDRIERVPIFVVFEAVDGALLVAGSDVGEKTC